MTFMFLLSFSESSLSAMQFSGVRGHWPSGCGKEKKSFRVKMRPGDYRLWLRDMCYAGIHDLWRRGF